MRRRPATYVDEEELFGQRFLVCPFAGRDRVFWIDTDIWLIQDLPARGFHKAD